MSNSKSDLLAAMDGKSITLGWDAVVSYNRDRINHLFAQQFVQKTVAGNAFSFTDQDLPPDHTPSDNGIYLHVSNLTMGQPLLSFDNATLDDSAASLSMQFLSGYFFSILETQTAIPSITAYNSVLPDSNYRLTMSLQLAQTTGEVSDQGDVFLDLSKADASGITVNLVDGDANVEAMGEVFQEIFENASDEKKIYRLGSLQNLDDSNPLNPKLFYLRTQPAPDTPADAADPGYGDGAVVLFVQTAASDGESGGSLPTSQTGFPYLIPDDLDSENKAAYSGSVILSSYTLLNSIVAPSYQQQLKATDLALQTTLLSNEEKSCYFISATRGFVPTSDINIQWSAFHNEYEDFYTATVPPLDIPYYPADGTGGFRLTPDNAGLNQAWQAALSAPLHLHRESALGNKDEDSAIAIDFSVNRSIGAALSDSNVVHFDAPASGPSINVDTPDIGSLLDEWDWADEQTTELQGSIRSFVAQALDSATRVDIPDVSLFTLSNLLFPNDNTLQLSDVSIPGDMALFGQIDPSTSTSLVTPTQITLVSGSEQRFSFSPAGMSRIDWTIDTPLADKARIENALDDPQSAIYVAPGKADLPGASMQEIITATATDSAGNTFTASAVVIVSANQIHINPSFIYAQQGQPEPVSLAASVIAPLPDGTPAWLGADQGSEASPVPGVYTASCTPALPPGQSFTLVPVTFSIGALNASANLLVIRQGLYPSVYVGAGHWEPGDDPGVVVAGNLTPLTAGGTRQLTALSSGINGITDVTTTNTVWSLMGDTGSLGSINTTTGLYTAPETITATCVVIMAIHNDEDFGYTVVPLMPGDA